MPPHTCVHPFLAQPQMGMGKTIQTIATIVAGMPGVGKPAKGKRKADAGAAAGEGHGPTLIVCPSSAMLQWADEVQRSTPEGAVKVVAFYGPGRAKLSKSDLESADIVLTTYVKPTTFARQEEKSIHSKIFFISKSFS